MRSSGFFYIISTFLSLKVKFKAEVSLEMKRGSSAAIKMSGFTIFLTMTVIWSMTA